MPRHNYPWWSHYAWENPLRRLVQRPEPILAPYLSPGMACLEIGCGIGYFTIPAARAVGPEGELVALDVDPKLLEVVRRRARRAFGDGRVEPILCAAEELDLDRSVDFVLAVWSLHELDEPSEAARRILRAMKPGARMLVAEPKVHVRRRRFEEMVRLFGRAGFRRTDALKVGWSHACLLRKPNERTC